MQSLSSPFWIAAEKGVKSGIDSAQADYYLQADDSADPQLHACNTMIERRPSIMLAAAIDPNNLLPCLQRAKELKVPVVDLGGGLDHDTVKNAGGDSAFSIQTDDQSVGTQAADYIAELFKQDAGQILILNGEPENIQSAFRAKGFSTQLSRIAPELEVIQTPLKGEDNKNAAGVVADTINSYPGLKAIFAVNDILTKDAAQALAANGVSNSVILIGADSSPAAIEFIKTGKMHASITSLPYLIGKQAVEQAVKLLDGDTTDKIVMVPNIVLTKELLEQGTDPMLEFLQ